MNISRAFLVIGSLYILVGFLIGMYMGGSNDHSLLPVHAHINLLGFVLMSIFGLVYRAIPAMADTMLAKAHFWLHQVGILTIVVMIILFFSGRIEEAAMVPLAPLAEGLVFLGGLCFAWNLFRNA